MLSDSTPLTQWTTSPWRWSALLLYVSTVALLPLVDGIGREFLGSSLGSPSAGCCCSLELKSRGTCCCAKATRPPIGRCCAPVATRACCDARTARTPPAKPTKPSGPVLTACGCGVADPQLVPLLLEPSVLVVGSGWRVTITQFDFSVPTSLAPIGERVPPPEPPPRFPTVCLPSLSMCAALQGESAGRSGVV